MLNEKVRAQTIAKYKQQATEILTRLARVVITWWLDLILVKDERETLKASVKHYHGLDELVK
jgi:hypothetical protein